MAWRFFTASAFEKTGPKLFGPRSSSFMPFTLSTASQPATRLVLPRAGSATGLPSTSISAKRFWMTSETAAAIGVQLPPVGPALKITVVALWASPAPDAPRPSAIAAPSARSLAFCG